MTPALTIAYDANGNTLTDPSGRSYTWDFENRLTQAVVPGPNGGTTTFKYDPFGRRIQKSGPLGTTNYLYDGSAITEEVDSTGNLLARYAPGASVDQALAELRSGTTSYYQADGLGSVTTLSSGAGAIANTYSYDSFGNSSGSSGTLTNPFQYTGREFDQETRIYLYRLRYYDPNTGRFLNEDPIAFQGGLNFFAYVNNSPTRFIDPSGLVGIEPATPQQMNSLLGLFPGSANVGGSIPVPGMSCSEVEKILEQNGYSTANNTPTHWYNSWLFNSPAHNGTEVHRHGGLHFVLKDNPGKDCDSGSCTITDLHNDPNDPLDHPIRHIIMDAIPWWLGTHPIYPPNVGPPPFF